MFFNGITHFILKTALLSTNFIPIMLVTDGETEELRVVTSLKVTVPTWWSQNSKAGSLAPKPMPSPQH